MGRQAVNYSLLGILLVVFGSVMAGPPESRVATFDRYDPTLLSYEVAGVEGESIDQRTLHVSWEVTDLRLPGNGDLDIVISRSFGRVAHTPSEMGHWYLGIPRIQIPTSPWRGPVDPASPANPTFYAAWNNLWARSNNGAGNICAEAGNLVDQYITPSLTSQLKGGIFYAAPITLYIPGEGQKILLEKLSSADQFWQSADYVTTDNWQARCISATPEHIWGGFEVVSPAGVRYRFDLIKHLVPGDYALGSSGGWVEMQVSSITDVHGNTLTYYYDIGNDDTGLLKRIVASDGRKVWFKYHAGSQTGVDVQGSPLQLISSIEYELNGERHAINYSYCDFSRLYILKTGCDAITLAPDGDLPVLRKVTMPNGVVTKYAYNGSMYSANPFFDWGGFEFLLDKITLPTGGVIEYEYDPGYSAIFTETNSPAPRLKKRLTSGPFVEPGEWAYTYSLANHIETTTVRSSGRQDAYEFYEGVGTYEYEIARRKGNYSWPDTAPTDFDELMGRLRKHTVTAIGTGKVLRETDIDYGLPDPIGKSYYGPNWLGWPTVVLSQVRQVLPISTRIKDVQQGGRVYSTSTPLEQYDEYGNPLVVIETGHDGAKANSWQSRETEYGYYNGMRNWLIGLPASISRGGRSVVNSYAINGDLLSENRFGLLTEYDYHVDGELHKRRRFKNGEAIETEYLNYAFGSPQLIREPIDSAAGLFAEHRQSINALGQTVWEQDADNNQYLYSYDSMGSRTAVGLPLSESIAFANIINDGELDGVIQTQGSRWKNNWLDGFGRQRLTVSSGLATSGRLKYAWWNEFDELGRPSFVSLPFNWVDTSSKENAVGVAYTYDKLGRVLQQTRTADNSTGSFCYMQSCNTGDYQQYFGAQLKNGYVHTNERGFQTAYEFSAYGDPDRRQLTRIVAQVKKSTGSGGAEFAVTDIDYGAWGNVLAIHQGEGAGRVSRFYDYDARQLLVEVRHPESGLTRHAYDELGNLVSTTDAAGKQTRFFYDDSGRLLKTDYPSDVADVNYSWTPGGLLTAIDNGSTRWAYAYNAEQRLTSEVLTLGTAEVNFAYRYNNLGDLKELTYPDGQRFDQKPDGFGRAQAFGGVVAEVNYWPNGSVNKLVYGNGAETIVGLNAALQPRSRQILAPNGQALFGQAYAYDAAGNITQAMDWADGQYDLQLAYDGLNRLVAADGFWGAGSIAYDDTGNLTAKNIGGEALLYNYDATHRLSSLNVGNQVFNYSYDAAGRQLSDGLRSFAFNAASQLVGQSGSAYEYDGHGRRTRIVRGAAEQIDVYGQSGLLLYTDQCTDNETAIQFYHIGRELVASEEIPCETSCHG